MDLTRSPSRAGEAHDAALAELLEEISGRVQAGEVVDLEEYARRYPDQAERLRALLPAVELLAALGSSASRQAERGPPLSPRAAEIGLLGDFRLLRELGRGGMGVVYEAEQLSLRRRVALKVLTFAGTLDPRRLQRFHNEAQAAACLHHAHIVPVHAVGCERGVHYYAMQLIDGQTLAALIEERKRQAAGLPRGGPAASTAPVAQADRATAPTAAPPTQPLAAGSTEPAGQAGGFWHLAARLGAEAAEALDHAHQTGIVHRDVKPANLLLGRDGQLWVTDFGLARVQADLSLTCTGDLVGTLRYMSPEQALGRRGVVDHRADIYSLGVTLYELLTLHPAFPGDNAQDLLRRIAAEEPPAPRRLERALPADLETVVLKAMAKDPPDRYATAGELARDLRRFLSDEPVEARRPPLRQRLARWGRRHPGAVWAAVLTLLLTSAVSVVAAALIYREKEATSRAYGRLTEEQGRTREALDLVERRERQLRRAYDEMSSEVINDLVSRQPRLSPEQRAFLERVLAHYEGLAKENGADPEVQSSLAVAHLRMGDIRYQLGQTGQAERAYRRAQGIYRALVRESPEVPAYRRNLAGSYNSLGLLFTKTGRPVEAEEAYREALRIGRELVRRHPAVPLYRIDLAASQGSLASVLRRAGKRNEAEGLVRAALAGQEELLREDPGNRHYRGDLATVKVTLGEILEEKGNPGEAEAAYREAIALYEGLVQERPDNGFHRIRLARAYNRLATLLGKGGRHAEAEKTHRTALRRYAELVRDFPSVPEYRASRANSLNNFCLLLDASGRTREAEELCREALVVRRALVRDFPEAPEYRAGLAGSHQNLGMIQQHAGKWKEAEESARAALSLWQELAGDHPGVPLYRLRLAGVYEHLASVHGHLGRPGDAEAAYGEAIKIQRGLLRDVPGKAAYRGALANSHFNLGNHFKKAGRPREAEAAFREAIELSRELAAEYPDDPRHRATLAGSLGNLGNLLAEGRLEESLVLNREALEIRRALVRDFPAVPEHRSALGDVCFNLGGRLEQAGRPAAAEEVYREGLPAREKLAADFPDNPEYQSRLGALLHNLAVCHSRRGETAEAAALARQAVRSQGGALRLRPGHGFYQHLLGAHSLLLAQVLQQGGDHAGAARVAQDLVDALPDRLRTYHDAFTILARCIPVAADDTHLTPEERAALREDLARRAREVVRMGRERVAASPADLNGLAWVLAVHADPLLRDPALAVETAREAVRVAPEEAAYWNTLGVAHYRAGDWDAAAAALEKSVALGKGGDAADGFFLAMTRWQQGDHRQARALYEKTVRGMSEKDRQDPELRRFYVEAAGLLGLAGPDPEPSPPGRPRPM